MSSFAFSEITELRNKLIESDFFSTVLLSLISDLELNYDSVCKCVNIYSVLADFIESSHNPQTICDIVHEKYHQMHLPLSRLKFYV